MLLQVVASATQRGDRWIHSSGVGGGGGGLADESVELDDGCAAI